MPVNTKSRRSFLRASAAAGVAVALPNLETAFDPNDMKRVAHAQDGPAPKRLIIWHWNDGVHLPHWLPMGDDLMSPQLADLVASRGNDINVVTGVGNENLLNGVNAHSSGMATILTGSRVVTGTFRGELGVAGSEGPSVDCVAANAIGTESPLPALRLTMSQNSCLHEGSNRISYNLAGTSEPAIGSPASAFDRLFAGFSPDGAARSAQIRARQESVLDYVMDDIQRVTQQCGVGDRTVLEQHLDSIREIELGLSRTGECVVPPDLGRMTAGLDPLNNCLRPAYDSFPERLALYHRMTALALRCDLTRVAVISLGESRSDTQYPWLGVTESDHTLSHLGDDYSQIGLLPNWDRVNRWKMAQLGEFLDELDVADGTGQSVLDHSAVVATSEMGNGATHLCDFLPVITAGRLGAMSDSSRRGRLLKSPCSEVELAHLPATQSTSSLCSAPAGTGSTPMSRVWLAALQAIGVPLSSFGEATEPLPELWV